jgi:hypothetical protein
MEAVYSSEKSGSVRNPEGRTRHNHLSENINSIIQMKVMLPLAT